MLIAERYFTTEDERAKREKRSASVCSGAATRYALTADT